MGFYINYLRFFDLIDAKQLKSVQGLWLLNAGTVSIAVFLHTMRFKKLLPPRVTFSLYVAMAYASFIGGAQLLPLFLDQPRVLAITIGGILLNLWRGKQYLLKAYFCAVCICFIAARFNDQQQLQDMTPAPSAIMQLARSFVFASS